MIQALGKVTVASPGVPIQVTDGLLNPTKHRACHGIMIQALPSNTGKIYIGNVELDSTTLVGCFAILAEPTANTLPTFSAALTIAPNGLEMETFWIDADVSDDGVLVTVLVL